MRSTVEGFSDAASYEPLGGWQVNEPRRAEPPSWLPDGAVGTLPDPEPFPWPSQAMYQSASDYAYSNSEPSEAAFLPDDELNRAAHPEPSTSFNVPDACRSAAAYSEEAPVQTDRAAAAGLSEPRVRNRRRRFAGALAGTAGFLVGAALGH